LLVLSRVHDPVDGVEISGETVIEEHISELLSSAGGVPKPIPPFVCFACPSTELTMDQLLEHSQSQNHRTALSGISSKFIGL
jgi:hypothetical protein